MLYEYRSYEAAEGRLEDLDRRFREVTVGLFSEHGFQQVGFWVPEGGNRLVYVLRWSDRAQRDAAWEAFQSDPRWQRGKASSEERGPLISTTSHEFWLPTSYSAAE